MKQPFDESALEALRSHVWPGNIRELANVVEHASIICEQLPVTAEHLPRKFGNRNLVGGKLVTSGMSLREIEAHAIEAALDRHRSHGDNARRRFLARGATGRGRKRRQQPGSRGVRLKRPRQRNAG